MKIVLTLGLFVISSLAYAGSIKDCTGVVGDYGDAPASYGVACHDTNRWQQLGGDYTRSDSLPGDPIPNDNYDNINWSSESSSKTNDEGDKGVKWSVSADGVNWSNFGTNHDITRGQYVKFQVDIKRATTGNHKYDQAKLWLDWFGTGSFINAPVVFDTIWDKDKNSEGVKYAGTNSSWNNDIKAYNSPDYWGRFISNAVAVPVNAALGETWLRARVICENSLTHANNFEFLPTGYYHQGEVEDYAVKIVAEVSEPSTIAVISLALIGFVARRKMIG